MSFQIAGQYEHKHESVFSLHVQKNVMTYSGSSSDIDLVELPSMKKIGSLKGHTNSVKNCRFSDDGKSLLSCSDDGTVKLWDLNSGKCAASVKKIVIGDIRKSLAVAKRLGDYHSDIIRQVKFYGKHLLSGSDDECVNMFDLNQQDEDDILVEVLRTDDSVMKFGFFENKFLYVLSHTHTLGIFDWTTNKKLISVNRQDYKVDYFVDVHFSSSSAYLFSGSFNGDIQMWKMRNDLKGDQIATFKGHSGQVCCSWMNDQCIITGGDDGKIILWAPQKK